MLHARLTGAGDAELVAQADSEDRHRMLLRGHLAHGVRQAADDAMLLGGDGYAGLAERLQDGLRVERLDDRDVQYLGLHSVLGLERLGRLQRAPDHVARADQRDVLALAQDVDAGPKRLGNVVVDARRRRTAEAHVHRLVALV